MYLIFFIVVVVIILCLLLKKRYKYWKERGVIFVEPNFLFGNVKDVFTLKSTEERVLGKIYEETKVSPYCGLFFLWKPVLMINDCELIKKILVTDFDHFVNHPLVSSATGTDRAGHSLFLMRDDEWKVNRTTFSKVFTPKQLKDWYKGVEENCSKIIPLLDESARNCKDVELENIIQRYAINVITATLFGLETDTIQNTNSEFIKHGRLVSNPPVLVVLKSLLYLLAPSFSQNINLQTFDPSSWQFFHKLVKDVAEYRETNGFINDDLFSILVKLKNGDINSSLKMTVEDMVGHVFAFFVAGYDTATLTTSYCLYELTENPEVQEKLRGEIIKTLEKHSGKLSYEAVQDMPYMDCVISETLRKYPPAGIIKRECSKDYFEPTTGLKVPKGMMVVIPVSPIQNDPDHFPDPDKFDPDRFSSGQSQNAYLPFGKGPRICLGMKLAEMEIKIALAMLLRHYEFLSSSAMTKPLEFDPKTVFVTVRPKNGLWVKIKHREI